MLSVRADVNEEEFEQFEAPSASPTHKHLLEFELQPDPERSSWSAKHGPGWFFEMTVDTHTEFEREIITYCAESNCRLYVVPEEKLMEALDGNPEAAKALRQLQLASTRRQLAVATEQLANLSDVLHFKPKKSV